VGADIARELGSEFFAAAQIPLFENTLYGARALSDDGSRLFFESSDALVARDTNGKQDVYEWEALGTGGCDGADVGFSSAAHGCIELISSGQSAKDALFVDASPSGNDVFFISLSSLLPQDFGLLDIYDARVGGGFPPPPRPQEPCEGEACQSPPLPSEAPTPSSSVLGGYRQVVPAEKHCREGRRAVRRKGKVRCLPRHHRHKHARNAGGRR
jgi:hypothetical protein